MALYIIGRQYFVGIILNDITDSRCVMYAEIRIIIPLPIQKSE